MLITELILPASIESNQETISFAKDACSSNSPEEFGVNTVVTPKRVYYKIA